MDVCMPTINVMDESPRVLSIQANVVSGYVSNKCSVFALQVLGFDVDPIHSMQYSNHFSHIVSSRGYIFNDADFNELLKGLAENNLDRSYTHILTGYIGSTSFLRRIADMVKDLKLKNKNLIYLCDPVLGDNGKFYGPDDFVPIYESILPVADIVTPNQFEAELLTGCKIESIDNAWTAIDVLHSKGCKIVLLSSIPLDEERLLALVSKVEGCDKEKDTAVLEIPKIPAYFIGVGDLCSALFLAWMHKTDDIRESLNKTMGTISAVLKRTHSYATAHGVSAKTMALRIIQSKKDIEEPVVTSFATKCKARNI